MTRPFWMPVLTAVWIASIESNPEMRSSINKVLTAPFATYIIHVVIFYKNFIFYSRQFVTSRFPVSITSVSQSASIVAIVWFNCSLRALADRWVFERKASIWIWQAACASLGVIVLNVGVSFSVERLIWTARSLRRQCGSRKVQIPVEFEAIERGRKASII